MADVKSSIDGDALEILKRLEPLLTGIDTRLRGIETDVAVLKTEMAGTQNRLSRIEGQLTHMPTAIGIATTILIAVIGNGAATAAIVFTILNYAKAG